MIGPAYRSDIKAVVERFFGTINSQTITRLPSAFRPRQTRHSLTSHLTNEQLRDILGKYEAGNTEDEDN